VWTRVFLELAHQTDAAAHLAVAAHRDAGRESHRRSEVEAVRDADAGAELALEGRAVDGSTRPTDCRRHGRVGESHCSGHAAAGFLTRLPGEAVEVVDPLVHIGDLIVEPAEGSTEIGHAEVAGGVSSHDAGAPVYRGPEPC
jgi:hypothetical protein